MKIKILTICTLLAMLFFFSCNNDDEPEGLPSDYVTSFTGSINLTPWESDQRSAGTSSTDSNYEIIASGQPTNPGHEYTTISIYFDSLDVGTYNIGFGEGDLTLLFNGVLDNTAEFQATSGTFSISLHDSVNKRIAGTLEFTSAVGFRDGEFDLLYEE